MAAVNSNSTNWLWPRVREMLAPKRRWFQFRMRTMLLMMTVASLVFGWPHIRRHYAFWKLREYIGIDLTHLPVTERERIDAWINTVLGLDDHEEPHPLFRPQNWLISESKGRLYVIQMEPTLDIPGRSYCQIHVFDHERRPVRSFRFNVGYRAWPLTALFDESKYGFLCFVVKTRGMWSGKTRQFYRVTDEQVELLRSEYLDGTAAMDGNLFELDEKPSDWSRWQRLLASDLVLDQMRGLAAFFSFASPDSLGPIDELTKRRLDELSRSDHPWIAEESTAATKFLAKREGVKKE